MNGKEKGYTTAKVNQEFKKQFSRRAQAKQFVDLFEEVVSQYIKVRISLLPFHSQIQMNLCK